MYDVWLIDFTTGAKRLATAGLKRKRAKRLRDKLNRRDRFSLAIVVPFGFQF